MPQLNGPTVNGDSDAQRTAVVTPFPMRLTLMAVGAETLMVVRMALEITIATRSDDVIHFFCGLDNTAQLAMLAKRSSSQGSGAGNLAPVSRIVIRAISIRHGRRRKLTTMPEWWGRVGRVGRGRFSMHTTLGERNQRCPPFHFAVVNRARSSSGKINARKNSPSLSFAGIIATPIYYF
jgi:hypothetical protein